MLISRVVVVGGGGGGGCAAAGGLQGRLVRVAAKGATAYSMANKAGVLPAGAGGGGGPAEPEMETVTMQLVASVPGGQTMLFSAPGYVGEHAVEVPAGLKVSGPATDSGSKRERSRNRFCAATPLPSVRRR